MVRALVAHGADVNGDTGSNGYPGRTPLYMVRKRAMVLLLLGSPDVFALRDVFSQAANKGDLKMVEALLVLGAEVSQRAAGGFTALHTAAGGGDVALVELLLKHGADPAAVAGEEHWTPLHRAAGGNGEPVIPESCIVSAKVG